MSSRGKARGRIHLKGELGGSKCEKKRLFRKTIPHFLAEARTPPFRQRFVCENQGARESH